MFWQVCQLHICLGLSTIGSHRTNWSSQLRAEWLQEIYSEGIMNLNCWNFISKNVWRNVARTTFTNVRTDSGGFSLQAHTDLQNKIKGVKFIYPGLDLLGGQWHEIYLQAAECKSRRSPWRHRDCLQQCVCCIWCPLGTRLPAAERYVAVQKIAK